ncbi:MAG: rhodanese-related sulfurtransferase, partial [Cytophagales bacterium]|nr:rhodanese-related sulfurtransferase [Cytophagales bacterium]
MFSFSVSGRGDYLVLLFYLYTPLSDPPSFRKRHMLLCLGNRMRGRVLVSNEGINGTLSGRVEDALRYIGVLRRMPCFRDIDFKIERHSTHAFSKLQIRLRDEIVRMGMPNLDPRARTGEYLHPWEVEELVRKTKDLIFLDVRSQHEHALGRFKDAITLDMRYFREFPNYISSLMRYRNKKIITYCTGGIRCEKASSYLLSRGFSDVSQIKGGILNYIQQTSGSLFEGSCYVFDHRVLSHVGREDYRVIGKC